ncbi:hypothetical protein [Rossellomorea aquimaris]|uniref:hypothetical protein n=1 Tax=Rossellomorea aquimaris TaxID=189382 RepID=UPI0005C9CE3E|nr:hypothetical protein [Rossellomorea aquimaris]
MLKKIQHFLGDGVVFARVSAVYEVRQSYHGIVPALSEMGRGLQKIIRPFSRKIRPFLKKIRPKSGEIQPFLTVIRPKSRKIQPITKLQQTPRHDSTIYTKKDDQSHP